MKQAFLFAKLLTLACSLPLAACGGGGGTTPPPPPPPVTITGKAEAPGGVIAQFGTGKPILLATIDFILPAVAAGITGLQPVGGATVELIRIDNDGNQIGSVLATGITSITGDYSLELPTGVSLAGDLIVRISGTTESISAMVVDQTVNINPISQFLLDKFVDHPDLILADLRVAEVVTLNGRVEQFDLTATADLSTMLAQLEVAMGQFVDNAVAVIDVPPDDGTASAAAAGNWHSSRIGLGAAHSDFFRAAALNSEIVSEVFAVTDEGNGDLTISSGTTVIDASANYSTDAVGSRSCCEYDIEVNVAGDEPGTAVIDADRNISLSIPFAEELDAVDVDDVDGPDSGFRVAPGSVLLSATEDGNTYVSNFNGAAVVYGTIDTNNDGVKDAINPADRRTDAAYGYLLLLLRQGIDMAATSLDGAFGAVSLGVLHGPAPQGVFESAVGEVSFSAGTATVQPNAQDTQQVIRTPLTLDNVTLTDNLILEPSASFPYNVSATGQVTLDLAGDFSDLLEGFTNADGSVIAFVDSEAVGAPTITNASTRMFVYVQLGNALTSSLNGATYKLHRLVYGMRTDGYSEISTLGNGTVVFDADATTASISGTVRGFSQTTDVSPIDSVIPANLATVYTVDSIADSGAIAMSMSDGTSTDTLKGFVSADSNLLILRVIGSDTLGGRDVGMMIGVKQ